MIQQRACDCVDVLESIRNCFYHLCNFKLLFVLNNQIVQAI